MKVIARYEDRPLTKYGAAHPVEIRTDQQRWCLTLDEAQELLRTLDLAVGAALLNQPEAKP